MDRRQFTKSVGGFGCFALMPFTNFLTEPRIHTLGNPSEDYVIIHQGVVDLLKELIRAYPDHEPELVFVKEGEIFDEESNVFIKLNHVSKVCGIGHHTINNIKKIKFFFNNDKCNILWIMDNG